MDALVWSILRPICCIISKVISFVFGRLESWKGSTSAGSRFESETIEDCGHCSRCVSSSRKRLEIKCWLVENYIADNLSLCDRLDQVLQLQKRNISNQLTLLRDLNTSSEHLKGAISDCLEKHIACVNQFVQVAETLRIDQVVEERVAIAQFEESIEEFRRNLMVNMVNNEKRGITDLLQEKC